MAPQAPRLEREQRMTRHIAIIDCGFGNVCSVANAFEHLGFRAILVNLPEGLDGAAAIVLPGVGSYAKAMALLSGQGMDSALTDAVIRRKTPFLGICLGMQMLAQNSDEEGLHQGLGWLSGDVRRMRVQPPLRLPHVGWNNVEVTCPSPLFDGIPEGSSFYFDHSYAFNAAPEDVVASCSYCSPVVAAVQSGHIFGTQFHPEKSQEPGLRLLSNFVRHTQLIGDVTC